MGYIQKFLILAVVSVSITHSGHAELEPTKFIYIDRDFRAAADKYGVDAKLLTAVFYVESNFNHTAVNPLTLDYGIGQINWKTAAHYNIDTSRMIKDRAYSIDRSAFVLSTFKKYNKVTRPESKAWVCKYNVGTGRLEGNRKENCIKYLKKIRWAYEVNELGPFHH